MGVINFNGLISPTLFTSFVSRKAAGAHRTADASYTYFLENDAVFEFRLEVQTSAGVVTVERHASAKNPLYDKTRPCYICDETPADAHRLVVDARLAGVGGRALALAGCGVAEASPVGEASLPFCPHSCFIWPTMIGTYVLTIAL